MHTFIAFEITERDAADIEFVYNLDEDEDYFGCSDVYDSYDRIVASQDFDSTPFNQGGARFSQPSLDAGMVASQAALTTPGHGLDGPDLNLETSGRVSSDRNEITYGKPGFGNYAYVDTNEYLLHYVEPVVEIVTPRTPDQSSSVPGASGGGSLWDSFNGMCDSINDFINKAVFVTEIDLENPNVAAVRAQYQLEREAANGETIRPDRGALDMAKTLGGVFGGPAGVLVGLEEATNTENSITERALAGAGVALSGMAVVGAISDANCVIKTSALGGPGCFTEGTQVVVGAVYDEDQVFVEYVTKNIEDIEVGDMVFSYDTITGTISQNEVTNVYVLESDHINYLTILDEKGVEQTIETTDAHPFWVVTNDPDLDRAASDYVYENGVLLLHENLGVTETGYWVSAKDLLVGDVFLDANGKLSTLTDIDRVEFPDGIRVYNFEVAGNHDYFVMAQTYEYGQTCILVHNAKTCHGNSLASKKPATLYARFDSSGVFQKWGISQNPDARYSKSQLGTDKIQKYHSGPRTQILAEERDLVETLPGPMNREPWAGKRFL